MNIEEFKTMFLAHVAWGWNGEYAAEMAAKANDPKECVKIFNRVKLVAYRKHISMCDALHGLIGRGNL